MLSILIKNQEYQNLHFYHRYYQVINVNDFCFLGLAFLKKKREEVVVLLHRVIV